MPPPLRAAPDLLAGPAVDALPQIVWISDSTGALKYCNRFWFDFTGLSPARLCDWREAIHPDDLGTVEARFARAAQAGGCYEVEYRIRRADGAYRWHLARVQCERVQQSDEPHWLGVAVDIDDRKRAEQRLGLQYLTTKTLAESRSFEEALERVLEGLGRTLGARLAEAWLSEGGRLRLHTSWRNDGEPASAFIEAGRNMIAMPGRGIPGIFGRVHATWISDLQSHPSLHRVKEAAALGLNTALILPILGQGKHIGSIVLWGPPRAAERALLDALEAIGLQLGLFYERKRVDARLRRQRKELIRSERAQREFVANVSHELRTPVAAIKGFAETLRRGGVLDPRNRGRFVRIIEKHADRLSWLIQDLLVLSSLEAGRLEPELLEIGPFVQEYVESVSSLTRLSGVKLVARATPGCYVEADRRHLLQVLENLVGNALKFSPPKGTVRVEAARCEGGVRLSVRDDGPGIAPENLERVFERFYKKNPANKTGAGLGLYIVRKIVDAHGGRVWAESRHGRGASFHVVLPLRRPTPAPVPEPDPV